jgi:hypothetical protein
MTRGTAAHVWAETTLRSALWLLLGGWVGAWVLFAFGVTTTAFRVLPSSAVAGNLVAPLLAGLHAYGAAAGVALALLARGLRRGLPATLLPLLLAGLCLLSHYGVTAEIDVARDAAFGPAGSLEGATRFTRLHQLSIGIFTAVGLGAIVLVLLHARADAIASRGETPTAPQRSM